MNKVKKITNKTLKFLALMLLNFYRSCISPIFPGCCRFRPTCSEYAVECFTKYPVHKAFVLTLKRLSKCHPFGDKGYDPVPENFEFNRKCKCK